MVERRTNSSKDKRFLVATALAFFCTMSGALGSITGNGEQTNFDINAESTSLKATLDTRATNVISTINAGSTKLMSTLDALSTDRVSTINAIYGETHATLAAIGTRTYKDRVTPTLTPTPTQTKLGSR